MDANARWPHLWVEARPEGERDTPFSPGAMSGTNTAPYGLASRNWTEHDPEELLGSLTALVFRLTSLRDESASYGPTHRWTTRLAA